MKLFSSNKIRTLTVGPSKNEHLPQNQGYLTNALALSKSVVFHNVCTVDLLVIVDPPGRLEIPAGEPWSNHSCSLTERPNISWSRFVYTELHEPSWVHKTRPRGMAPILYLSSVAVGWERGCGSTGSVSMDQGQSSELFRLSNWTANREELQDNNANKFWTRACQTRHHLDS